MSTSYADVLNLADKNARKTAKELDAERRKREQLKRLQEKSRPIDDTAIKQILERRRREQEQQKIAEKQRLKQINELRKQKQTQLSIQNSTKKQPQKPLSTPKPPPPPPAPKPSVIPKKPAPNIPYEDLMRYASLKANRQPIPKELERVAESLRANKSDSTKKPPPSSNKIPPRPTSASNNSKQPVRPSSASSSSSSSRLSKTQNNRAIIEQKSNRNPPTQKTSQRSSQSNGQKASQPMNRSMTNGQRSLSQFNGQRSSQSLSRSSTNGQISTSQSKINRPRPVLSNGQRPAINGQRSSLPPSRKRPALDTDDEDDGADLDDFIVDDDDDNESNYRKELHDTLRTNFRFDVDRYRRRVIEEDDDDLRHMESSYAQIEKEEDYSARVGLQEDIDDIIREQAEKKRLSQMKKRPKPAP